MRAFTRPSLFLHQWRSISSNPTFIFTSDHTVVPVSSIGSMWNAVYNKEFKNKHMKLGDLELGENIICIRTTDKWYHWTSEKNDPRLYNELTRFIKDGYKNQFTYDFEPKPPQKPETPKTLKTKEPKPLQKSETLKTLKTIEPNPMRYEAFKY